MASIAHKLFDKKTGSGVCVNEQSSEKLHEPAIKNLKKRKIYARFKGKICAERLAEMESLSSTNKNVEYLLCVIDFFLTIYACVKLLKNNKLKTGPNALIEIVNQCLDNKEILMYSIHSKGK